MKIISKCILVTTIASLLNMVIFYISPKWYMKRFVLPVYELILQILKEEDET